MPIKIVVRLLVCVAMATLPACTTSQLSIADVNYFQPPIVETIPPSRPLNSYSLYNNTVAVKLTQMLPIIPAFNGKGNLLASWNPHPLGASKRPTFVIVHGGHGLVPTDFSTALWAQNELGANVLILDSFWSRGRQENWLTYTNYGVNMRILDAIAAGRWLQTKGIDTDKLFIIGGSQGGWTVLRLFTDEPFLKEQATKLYRAGISLYPNCTSKETRDDPKLGPYLAPVIVFTGGKDTATPTSQCPSRVFSDALKWVHYPEATHAWDTSNRGAHQAAVDGECAKALNTYNHFQICRSDRRTEDMRKMIREFLRDILK